MRPSSFAASSTKIISACIHFLLWWLAKRMPTKLPAKIQGTIKILLSGSTTLCFKRDACSKVRGSKLGKFAGARNCSFGRSPFGVAFATAKSAKESSRFKNSRVPSNSSLSFLIRLSAEVLLICRARLYNHYVKNAR